MYIYYASLNKIWKIKSDGAGKDANTDKKQISVSLLDKAAF